MRVALFITCLTDTFFPRSGMAVVKVLEHLGHEVVFPETQTCCGQPMHNCGFEGDTRDLARRMIEVFRPYETIVTPSGSCAAMVREHYAGLFPAGSEDRAAAEALAGRTYEFVEFLTNVLAVDLAAIGVRWNGAATYHYSCHLRGLGMTDEAARLMQQIEGLDYRPLTKIDQCCGFGGTFAMRYPQISGRMVAEKVDSIVETGAGTVVSNDGGCTMNIAGACRRAGCDAEFRTLAEIVAEGLGLLEPESGA